MTDWLVVQPRTGGGKDRTPLGVYPTPIAWVCNCWDSPQRMKEKSSCGNLEMRRGPQVSKPRPKVVMAGQDPHSRVATSSTAPALPDTVGADQTGTPVAHGCGAAAHGSARRPAGRGEPPADGSSGTPVVARPIRSEVPFLKGGRESGNIFYLFRFYFAAP